MKLILEHAMAENINVNNSWAIMQPLLVPFGTDNGSDVSPDIALEHPSLCGLNTYCVDK